MLFKPHPRIQKGGHRADRGSVRDIVRPGGRRQATASLRGGRERDRTLKKHDPDTCTKTIGTPIRLVYGVRTPHDFIYEKELHSYAGHAKDFSLAIALSRPDSGWGGLSGRIPEVLPGLISRYDGEVVYLCGPPEMVAASCEFFRKAGYPGEDVRKEQW